MSVISKVRAWLLGKPKTAGYRPTGFNSFVQPRQLPRFDFDQIRLMLCDPTIRLGLAMREAPLYQAEFAYRDGDDWVSGVKCENKDVAEFVEKQLQRIWQNGIHKILKSQVWGWSAGEVMYKLVDGKVQYDRILAREAHQSYALTEDSELKGVRFLGGVRVGQVDLRFPKAFWHAYRPEAESSYGWSILRGAHQPWADKSLEGGACDVRRLFMHKDAYGGADLTYPPGSTILSDGADPTPNRDIAREIVEQIKAGGVTTRPADFDPQTGNNRWELTRATIPGNPQHILQFPKDLDIEILRGLEIPDDVLISENGGAWQGKQVPMMAFFVNADKWLTAVISMLVEQILEWLVEINFGPVPFQVTAKPLGEQAMEAMQNTEPETNPQRMSFDAELAVGQGILQASHLVSAGRQFLDAQKPQNGKFPQRQSLN